MLQVGEFTDFDTCAYRVRRAKYCVNTIYNITLSFKAVRQYKRSKTTKWRAGQVCTCTGGCWGLWHHAQKYNLPTGLLSAAAGSKGLIKTGTVFFSSATLCLQQRHDLFLWPVFLCRGSAGEHLQTSESSELSLRPLLFDVTASRTNASITKNSQVLCVSWSVHTIEEDLNSSPLISVFSFDAHWWASFIWCSSLTCSLIFTNNR